MNGNLAAAVVEQEFPRLGINAAGARRENVETDRHIELDRALPKRVVVGVIEVFMDRIARAVDVMVHGRSTMAAQWQLDPQIPGS